ncbi:MAG: BACON domain-containing carbohydrate-binding protein [Proteiniphilum sp.]|nr:BACON domain-containing carbohydrate-binding protein [Proteiniphilum sp.]
MKKLHSRKLIYLILILCSFLSVACQEFVIDSQPEGPLNIQIDAQDTYRVLATSPSNVVFHISSNSPWAITSDQQWCKPDPAMSAASSLVSEIVVAIEANTGRQSRTARLTIKAEGIAEAKVIIIEQTSKENLVVIPYDGMVPAEGGKISFNIISNKPWEIIPSTQFLEHTDKNSGQGNENGEKEAVSITIPENPGSRRSGTLTVKTDFETFTFTVHQDGVVIEQEEPSPSGTIDFGWSESEKIVKVRSNKAWKVTVPNEYAEWIKAEALSQSELKISLKPNNRLITRKGDVLLSTVEVIPGFESVSFGITQKPSFWFSGSNYHVDAETGNVKVMAVVNNNIVSNYPFRKGHLTFQFAEMHLTGTSRLVFNMWPNKGNTNFHFWLRSDAACQFTCGGSGFAWEQKKFSLTTEQVNAIRKIEFFVEDDPNNAGKLRLRLLIDGEEKGVLSNKKNCYAEDPANNPGQVINLQIPVANSGDYYVIERIIHEPYE